ncbi:MAG: NAD(P)/FAD-dependent oxidoreductase [Thermoclostridium sp.]|nr:NAD(P)/FAD-dependent oxidoreductase [Thermoclostridium sp.]
MYDAIIIGKGPAGISAALYTVRANMKTLVFGTRKSTLEKADKIENYYGFSQPISGEKLLAEGEKQLLRLGGEIRDEEVISISKEELFQVSTTTGTWQCHALLIATGQKNVNTGIRNLKKFEGKGASYCTTCDGFFYRGKKAGVLGFNDFALHEAKELLPFTKDITLFTNGKTTTFSKDTESILQQLVVNETPIRSFEGEEFLEKIVFEDDSVFPLDGIFIAYESASSTTFALKMGILMQDQYIVTDANQCTNIDGLYAAGDCTGIFKQISVAVGQGAIAGRNMIEYIRKQKQP